MTTSIAPPPLPRRGTGGGAIIVRAAGPMQRYGATVVVNTVEKFGADDLLERAWDLPTAVSESLRPLVQMTPEGWVVDAWPMTAQLAAIVQPWVDEPVDVESGCWFVSSARH
ncbi:hypothetical protein [Micromonospora sp. NPDC049107]|uniref:hypothetical protein n=1 Tax=unclassified Micromonospora TaxID=2617518 RepID=UPI0033E3EB31